MIDLGPLTFTHKGLQVVFDNDLGHHRLDPYPTAEAVKSYYEDDQFYESHSPPDWFKKELNEWKNVLWDSYYNYLFRLGDTHNAILDYGCGCGWFVAHCRYHTLALECEGVEPSKAARQFAADHLPLIKIYPSIDNSEMQYYDAIYLNLVLEHIPYPVDFLKDIVARLRQWGRLIIVVPNEFNRLQLKLNYYGFINQVHVNYFAPQTLRGVMQQAGLKVVHESATFPMELFPVLGANYFGNDEIGRKCHRLRLHIEKLFGWRIFNLYQKLYNRGGVGRELIFVGEKG